MNVLRLTEKLVPDVLLKESFLDQQCIMKIIGVSETFYLVMEGHCNKNWID